MHKLHEFYRRQNEKINKRLEKREKENLEKEINRQKIKFSAHISKRYWQAQSQGRNG